MLRPFVSTRFQVLFHSPYRGSFHLSVTVLVRYRSPNVFSLGKWASQLPTELACSAVLRILIKLIVVSCTGLSPFTAKLSRIFPLPLTALISVLQPQYHIDIGLGFSPFARHYSGNHFFSSGYLDVSVHLVPTIILCVQIMVLGH